MVPIYLIAIKTNWLQTCMLAQFYCSEGACVYWRLQEDTGEEERAERSQEVGKENKTGGRQRQMTTSTCPNWRLFPPSDAPILGGEEKRRRGQRRKTRQRKRDSESNDRSFLVYLFLSTPATQSTVRGQVVKINNRASLFAYRALLLHIWKVS